MTNNYTNWSGLELQLNSDLKNCEEAFQKVTFADLLLVTKMGEELLERTINKVIKRGFVKHHASDGTGTETYTAWPAHMPYFNYYTSTTPNK